MPRFPMRCHKTHGLVVPIKLVNPATKEFMQLDSVLDTGADRTAIRDDIAMQLELPIVRKSFIDSVNRRTPCLIYTAVIQFILTKARKPYLHNVGKTNVVGISLPGHAPCLIGRDILRKMTLVYNGRANSFTLSV